MSPARALATSWVPPHLRQTYPADFSLFLLLLGMAGYYMPPGAGLSWVALLAATVCASTLWLGWFTGFARVTQWGAILSTSTWLGQIFYLVATRSTDYPGSLEGWQWWAAFLVSVAGANTAVGVWLLLLPAETDDRGRWWMLHRGRLG